MKYIRQKLGPKKKKRDYIIEEMFKEVKEEVDKYSLDIWEKFITLFPCCNPQFKIPHKKIRIIIIKYRSVGMTTMFCNPIQKITLYIKCSSVKDFWERWNRFKKMMAFL